MVYLENRGHENTEKHEPRETSADRSFQSLNIATVFQFRKDNYKDNTNLFDSKWDFHGEHRG